MRDKAATKRDRILGAATKLFRERGVRATTMEAIAASAGVAKATAYAHFDDKEAVFRAVCERVALLLTARTEEAALLAKGSRQKVSAALAAKYGLVWSLVHSSPHAADLLASTDEAAAGAFDKTDARFTRLLTSLLREADAAGEIRLGKRKAGAVAALLMSSSDGVGVHAKTARAVDAGIAELVALVWQGLSR